uniref:Small monomeric GTPase n=1 Tax=Monopterus albus TaxID=43700 RepID=A0A3Q3IPA7_MONAL
MSTTPSGNGSTNSVSPSVHDVKAKSKKKKKKSPGMTQQKIKKEGLFALTLLFNVVLVGNSRLGKTSLLHSFSEGCFHPFTTATMGTDYSVQTLTRDNMEVAMELLDTGSQEGYCSITKQFFHKGDGVVVQEKGYPSDSEASFKEAEQLACKNKVMLFEVSAYTGKNVTRHESLTHVARMLMEQEDRARHTTVILKKKKKRSVCCCQESADVKE